MKALLLTFAALLCTQGSHGVVVQREDRHPPTPVSHLREVTLDDRYNCSVGDIQPPNRVDTTERVAQLRQEMANYGLDAYLILMDDRHQSEYVAPADMRIAFISGFSGSAATVVVTMTEQALWTDGRYFLQSDSQLDCNWLLMKEGLEGVPSVTQWITEVLASGQRVGSDPALMSASLWLNYDSALSDAGIVMVPEQTNLVDLVWVDQPPYSTNPAYVLGLEFAGQAWEDKVADVRAELSSQGADMLVLAALDEVAWTLNMRGSDIPYNPVFYGYLLVGQDRVQLFTPPEKGTPEVQLHLHTADCGTSLCTEILPYEDIVVTLEALSVDAAVNMVLANPSAISYSLYNAIPANKRMTGKSPVSELKAVKNAVEIQGMRNAHVKDGVALCDYFAFMETEITQGNYWDELTASNKSLELRQQQQDFTGLSFTTISAFGPNGAIIHYEPTTDTNAPIDTSSLYLFDSGSQFKDGTTDVTRTVHYGTPTAFEIEAYTRVLQGQLDWADVIFPANSYTSSSDIDILARRSLYSVGLDYRHGTSHGIGMFLFVHEHLQTYYTAGEFMSDEPGYYEDGQFGIRLENTVECLETTTPYDFTGPSLTFRSATLVPYEPKLINTTMLTQRQCFLLNDYHSRVLDVVGTEMLNQGRQDGYNWLVNKTQPLSC